MSTYNYTYKFDDLMWVGADGVLTREPPPAVAEQLTEYGRYYNKRIEIVRASRTDYRTARSAEVPGFAVAEDAYKAARERVEQIRTEIKAGRQDTRQRNMTPDQRERLTLAVQFRKSAAEALKTARLLAAKNPALKSKAEEINAARKVSERTARASTKLHWGSYLLVEDATRRAAADATVDPAFKSWRSGLPTASTPPVPAGKVGVQIQSTCPLTVAGLFAGNDTRIRLAPPTGSAKKKRPRSTGAIRIGSNGREPVWAEFSVRVRRDMPLDGRVTWVWIKRWRAGTRWLHALYVGVRSEAPVPSSVLDRAIAIDLNMRIVSSGIRIGYTFDGAVTREYVLPQAIIDKMEHARSIQSIRDREFNAFRLALAAWLKLSDTIIPEWLKERTQHLSQWRSQNRLAGVVLTWRHQRFDGDDDMYKRAEAWRSQDRHLHDYHYYDDLGARRRRTKLYEAWALELSRTYGTTIVASWDWSEIARRPKPEDDNTIPDAVRTMRQNVGLSDFVQALKHAARSRGGRLIEADMPPAACPACGGGLAENPVEGRATCNACGQMFVRDEIQARRLYAMRERLGGDDGTGGARTAESVENSAGEEAETE